MTDTIRQTLAADGRVGRDLLAVDWRGTTLGGPDDWPESLCQSLRLMLASGFPMWLAWGEDLTFFCNDAYRRRTLGSKYPSALGRPTWEVWPEIRDALQPRFDHVFATGEATSDEALRMFLERSGYVEETYFTFSCSPVADDGGRVGGVMLVVAEVTHDVVNSRRMDTLRHLGIRVSVAESVVKAVEAGCEHLASNNESLPWVAAYLFDERLDAVLTGTSGIEPGHAAAPLLIGRDDPEPEWPLGPVLRGEQVIVPDVDRRFPSQPTGAWTTPPRLALVVPLRDPLQEHPYGFLVFGANPHRPVDAAFTDFCELISRHFSAAITDARTVEEHRRHSETLLDQAERLARLGSWEIDLREDRISGSRTFLEIIERTPEQLERLGARAVSDRFLSVAGSTAIRDLETAGPGELVEYETPVVLPSGRTRTVHVRGEVVDEDEHGPRLLRGSAQDVTEQRQMQARLMTAEAERRVSARERAIADELQRSLLPDVAADSTALEVATFYRPGLAGTQVGGDWYDVIDLGGGRTALIIGDVMGHGVRAAAVMGQVKAAVRAYARLDLPPAAVAENMDGLVQDMAGHEIVTWVYAVFDPAGRSVSYANAGHLPPVVVAPDGETTCLFATGPPLGAGFFGNETRTIAVQPGTTLALYTDGLTERRHQDIDAGLDTLVAHLVDHRDDDVADVTETLVEAMSKDLGETSDDIALAVVRVQDAERRVAYQPLDDDPTTVATARHVVEEHLASWQVPAPLREQVVLVTSELVTNAITHGVPPMGLRLQRTESEVVVEVRDGNAAPPRRRRAGPDDEDGRGLAIVDVVATRWGTRSTAAGKVVWAAHAVEPELAQPVSS